MPERNKFQTPDLSESRLVKLIVRVVVVILIAALGIFLYLNTHEKEETETERGVARLQELEAIDVAETEKTIRGLREQNTSDEMSSNEELTSSLKGEYLDASALVVGDSSVQLLLDYDILDESCVIATIGGGVATSSGMINTAIAMAPQRIILNLGLDDQVYFEGDATEFAERYEALIQTIKEGLPRVEIYVSEITPVAQDALEMQPEYAHVDDFNLAIKKLCRTMNVNFLETADLIDGEYATDGIHPSYSYYVDYATRILNRVSPKKGGNDEDAGLAAGDGND